MKELVRHIFKRDYLSEHNIEAERVASLIKIVKKRKQGNFRGIEDYAESLRNEYFPLPFYKHPFSSWVSLSYESKLTEKFHVKRFLELANQLHAIEELGRSSNKRALDYLRFLSKENVKTVRENRSVMAYSPDTIYHEWTEEEHRFPNARGALRFFLDFNVKVTTTNSWGDEIDASGEENLDRPERFRRLPAHQILNNAIATLERDLKIPPR